MKIRRYRSTEETIVSGPTSRFPSVTQLLMQQGVLAGWPVQIKRDDLTYDSGIDIVYRLRRMTPARFREYSEALLLAAFTEASRYKDEAYKFGKFVVKLNRNEKGRKTIEPLRTYVAAKHPDAEIMVYGKEALGYTPTVWPMGAPAEREQKSFLINKVEDILGIPDSTSPGPYVDKQRPYTVTTMVVSIRSGTNLEKEARLRAAEESGRRTTEKAMERMGLKAKEEK